MPSKRKAIVDWCVKSLTEEPEAWQCGYYTCTHRVTGVTIWVANSMYGLAIYATPARADEEAIGGVTMLSTVFGFITPWRVRIFNAVKRAKRSGQATPEDAIIASIEAAT